MLNEVVHESIKSVKERVYKHTFSSMIFQSGSNPLLPQSAVEEDGVSWIEEPPGDPDCIGEHTTTLTPSEVKINVSCFKL